jgi:aminoglycoside/choline kinase family phosphotransferase
MNRDIQIDDFLARHGFAAARRSPLAQDASFRRYLRLTGGPAPAVLMDAPPPEDVRPFLRIARHLAGIGLSVPTVFGVDVASGLLLEEDLGDGLISVLLDDPHSNGGQSGPDPTPDALFDGAVDALVAMQRAAPPPDLPAWNAAAMTQTAVANLIDWWWPAAMGGPAPEAARTDFTAALEVVLEPLRTGPRCFVHRDYFAGNLLHLPTRPGMGHRSRPSESLGIESGPIRVMVGAGPPSTACGADRGKAVDDGSAPTMTGVNGHVPDGESGPARRLRAVGIIDFQSAAIGHPAYDLVSLLQDARRDIPPSIEAHALARYLAARPELDPDAFRAAYAACAAQRHLRVACQWVRLAKRDNRPQYLVHGPRTWGLLAAALTQDQAQPLAQAFDRWIPMDLRRNPPGLAA